MPTPPPPRAVRALRQPIHRRLRHLLALTAVALPLLAADVAPSGVPAAAAAAAPSASAPPVVAAPSDAPGGADAPTRLAFAEERRHLELPAPIVRIEDPDLLRGFVEVEQEGRTGLRTDTHLVLLVDGTVTARLHLASRHVRGSVARIERVGTGARPDDTVWDALARCESSGRWDAVRTIDGEVAYRGGLQFADSTWDAFRPAGLPALASDATREQQILVAERVLDAQGWGAWPACAQRLGLG